MRRRRAVVTMPNFGPFFSTDAGGRPASAMQGAMGQTDGVPAVNVPGMEDFVQTAQGMQIPTFGIFTPWGKLVQAPTKFGWQVAPLGGPADTNLIVFEMSEVAALLSSLGFGQPAFLAVLSDQPIRPEQISAAFSGTPYGRYGDGITLYSQNDQTGVPKVYFLYWLGLRDPGDPDGGASSSGAAAQALGAALVFAQQVAREATDSRGPAGASAYDAAQLQYPTVFPPKAAMAPSQTPPPPQEPEAPPTAQASFDVVPPLLIGGATAVLGILIGRTIRSRRR